MSHNSAIIRRYKNLFRQHYKVEAEVNMVIVGRMIKNLLRSHTEEGLIRVVELYFEYEPGFKNHTLHNILSNWSINKYLPKAKLNPDLYDEPGDIK